MTKVLKNTDAMRYYNANFAPVVHKNKPLNGFKNLFDASAASVDSLKIRIPLNKVWYIDPRMTDHCILVSKNTGAVLDENEFKKHSLSIEDKGIKTRFAIQEIISGRGKQTNKFLTILVSSKTLKENYFYGITNQTANTVYDYLMSLKIATFSFSDFMESECVDIDVKADLKPSVPVVSVVNRLYEQAEKKRAQRNGCSVYRKKTNLGIQFALRKTNSFKKCPYLKFYEKVRELKTRSTDFMNAFLNEGKNLPSEILRIETTIKNKKHLQAIGHGFNTLSSILNDLQDIARKAFHYAFRAHLNGFKMAVLRIRDEASLTLSERVLLDLIFKEMKSGFSYKETADRIILRICKNKSERYKLKTSIKTVFSKSGSRFENDSIEDELNAVFCQN